MLKQEIITINDRQLRRTYSDENKVIRKIGTTEEYAEAIDLLTSTYTYEETDKYIEDEEVENK